jgi:hypothetical protein
VTDPAERPGGLAEAAPPPPARAVTLLQRKAERPGKRLGKTTGWIHRASLQARGVRMLGGRDLRADHRGRHRLATDKGEELIEGCDTVVLCAGQESLRGRWPTLLAAGMVNASMSSAAPMSPPNSTPSAPSTRARASPQAFERCCTSGDWARRRGLWTGPFLGEKRSR